MRFQTKVLPGHRIEISDPHLAEGDRVDVLITPVESSTNNASRQNLLQLSPEQRRKLLAEQCDRVAPHYSIDQDWQGGDILD